MNDDTGRRQSRRETERRSARTWSSRCKLYFFIKEKRRRSFVVLPISRFKLLRYPTAFPFRGKGDHVVVDEGNLYRKSKWDNAQALRIMKSSASQKMKSNPFHPPQRISSRSDFIPSGISPVSKRETDLIATFGRLPSSLNCFRYRYSYYSRAALLTPKALL